MLNCRLSYLPPVVLRMKNICCTFRANLMVMVRHFHFRVGKYLIDFDLDLDRLYLFNLFNLFH